MRTRPWLATLCLLACSGRPAAAPPAAPVAAEPTPAAQAPATAKPAVAEAAPAAPPANEEGCAQILLVSYDGAAHARPGIGRTKPAAAARASELLAKLAAGTDFAELATKESDAPSSAPRGGLVGTFSRADWPALHAALRDPLFQLAVGQVAPAVIDADYGYVLLRRCTVEKIHARHILIRYKGAKGATPQITRTKKQAEQQARALLHKLQSGADFAELARQSSEDGSAKRGGDLGVQARGAFALPFEQALFALRPGDRSAVVESEFGYHLIERLAD
jgi:parvulin-like peptidyl-prolyl isomerase